MSELQIVDFILYYFLFNLFSTFKLSVSVRVVKSGLCFILFLSFIFIFIYFLVLNLKLQFSVILQVTTTNYHTTILS